MIGDVIAHLVSGIVQNPDDVQVKAQDTRRGLVYRVHVNPSDLGKVIGRKGRTATAIRTVASAIAGREKPRIDFVDVDRD